MIKLLINGISTISKWYCYSSGISRCHLTCLQTVHLSHIEVSLYIKIKGISSLMQLSAKHSRKLEAVLLLYCQAFLYSVSLPLTTLTNDNRNRYHKLMLSGEDNIGADSRRFYDKGKTKANQSSGQLQLQEASSCNEVENMII